MKISQLVGIPCLTLLSSALLSLTSCSDNTFKKYTELSDLRVLAIQADKAGFAEFSPGETGITVTPYISDFNGGTRALEYEAKACFDPGIAVGADPSCDNVPGAVSFTGSVTLPGAQRIGAVNTFSVDIPATVFVGRSAIDQFNGVNYLVTYRLYATDGSASVKAFKRLVVSDAAKTTKNRNPQISDVTAAGSSLTAYPTEESKVRAAFAAGTEESYETKTVDGTTRSLSETLITSWLLTAGEFELDRTFADAENTFKPKDGRPTSHTPLFVVILRDDRGGVSVLVRSL